MTLEIQFLVMIWERHKNVLGSNWLINLLQKVELSITGNVQEFRFKCVSATEYHSSNNGLSCLVSSICTSTSLITAESNLFDSHPISVIPKVPWTSLDIWSSKGRTFTRPNHFLLDQKKLTQFKCNILFFCIFIYMQAVFNFIMPIFTKVIIIIIFAIFCMS